MQYPPLIIQTEEVGELSGDFHRMALPDKINYLSAWLKSQRNEKARYMLFMVMYDIENNRIRTQIAKYLIRKGCLRIQKSVYLCKDTRTVYREISETLKEINEMYENHDSIFVLPVPEEKFRHMKVIGKNVEFEVITEEKSYLFI